MSSEAPEMIKDIVRAFQKARFYKSLAGPEVLQVSSAYRGVSWLTWDEFCAGITELARKGYIRLAAYTGSPERKVIQEGCGTYYPVSVNGFKDIVLQWSLERIVSAVLGKEPKKEGSA